MKGKIKEAIITGGNQKLYLAKFMRRQEKELSLLKYVRTNENLNQNLIIKKIDKETVNVQLTDNEMLMAIVGQFDQNLKDLAKLTNTNIFFRGNSITCKGKIKILN